MKGLNTIITDLIVEAVLYAVASVMVLSEKWRAR